MAHVNHFGSDSVNDTFDATSAPDWFYGYGGTDTASYEENAPAGLTASLASPSLNTGWASGDQYFSIENLTGTHYSDNLYGNGRDNGIDGAGSSDHIYGGKGHDTLIGNGGSDFLYGQDGNDVINGQWQNDTAYGGNGNDTIYGGTNNDTLYGEAGNDVLHGDALTPSEYYVPVGLTPGSDALHGGAGSDILNGDGGNDTSWGDAGADTFVFNAPYTVASTATADGSPYTITFGSDVIADFQVAGTDHDYLQFDHALFSSSSDVLSHAAQSGADVVITYDPNDTVTLQNVLLDSLRAHPEDILIA